MDTESKLFFIVGFLDCWQMFKQVQKDPNTALKKAYIFQKLIEEFAPSWTESQIVELIDKCREVNIIHKISDLMTAKKQVDEMYKEIKDKKWKTNKL